MNKAKNKSLQAGRSPQSYLVSYFEMGMMDEAVVTAADEEEAYEIFWQGYTPKTPYLHIARVETLQEAQLRKDSPRHVCLMDECQYKYLDFANAYYEALNN